MNSLLLVIAIICQAPTGTNQVEYVRAKQKECVVKTVRCLSTKKGAPEKRLLECLEEEEKK